MERASREAARPDDEGDAGGGDGGARVAAVHPAGDDGVCGEECVWEGVALVSEGSGGLRRERIPGGAEAYGLSFWDDDAVAGAEWEGAGEGCGGGNSEGV